MKRSVLNQPGWILLFFGLTLFFSGCKKENDEVSPAAVEGRWNITAYRINPALDLGPLGKIDNLVTFFNGLTGTTCFTDVTLTFKSGGTIETDNPQSCKDINEDAVEEQTGFDETSKWALDGTKLTVSSSSGEKEEYTVSMGSGTMQWVGRRDEDFEQDGTPTNYTVTIDFRRAK